MEFFICGGGSGVVVTIVFFPLQCWCAEIHSGQGCVLAPPDDTAASANGLLSSRTREWVFRKERC